jgi:hypothetical protein
MAKPPPKPPSKSSGKGPPKGRSKPPVKTSAPVRSAAGSGLRDPKSLTPAQRRALAASEERHIEPRVKPKGEPPKPKTTEKVKAEGGKGLANALALTKKQAQSLAGSVLRHIPRVGQSTPAPKPKPPTRKP